MAVQTALMRFSILIQQHVVSKSFSRVIRMLRNLFNDSRTVLQLVYKCGTEKVKLFNLSICASVLGLGFDSTSLLRSRRSQRYIKVFGNLYLVIMYREYQHYLLTLGASSVYPSRCNHTMQNKCLI